MVNRNLLRQYDPVEDDLQQALALDHVGADWLRPEEQEFRDNRVVTGRVCKVTGDEVWVDVGYKSEGAVELREWYDDSLNQVVPPQPGDEVEVRLEPIPAASSSRRSRNKQQAMAARGAVPAGALGEKGARQWRP